MGDTDARDATNASDSMARDSNGRDSNARDSNARDTDEVLAGIGPRLRRLRTTRGLTLEALAAESGLSISLLSRLETGKRQPTLDALIPLARSYRMPLDRLVGMPELGDPAIHLQPRRIRSGGVVVPLTRDGGRRQVFKHVLRSREPKLATHDGQAWLYVLAGRLRLILDDEETELAAGETAEFDSRIPHWFGPAAESVEILHIFDPRGGEPVAQPSGGEEGS